MAGEPSRDRVKGYILTLLREEYGVSGVCEGKPKTSIFGLRLGVAVAGNSAVIRGVIVNVRVPGLSDHNPFKRAADHFSRVVETICDAVKERRYAGDIAPPGDVAIDSLRMSVERSVAAFEFECYFTTNREPVGAV